MFGSRLRLPHLHHRKYVARVSVPRRRSALTSTASCVDLNLRPHRRQQSTLTQTYTLQSLGFLGTNPHSLYPYQNQLRELSGSGSKTGPGSGGSGDDNGSSNGNLEDNMDKKGDKLDNNVVPPAESEASKKLCLGLGEGEKMVLSEEEWRERLSPQAFHILREKGTEPPRSGEYDAFDPPKGYFACRGCGNPLYSAAAKFHSGCGWPSFDKCVAWSVKTHIDTSFGMTRIEILCNKCDGHLGHIFEGERFTETDQRHCVNSLSIQYHEQDLPANSVEAKLDSRL